MAETGPKGETLGSKSEPTITAPRLFFWPPPPPWTLMHISSAGEEKNPLNANGHFLLAERWIIKRGAVRPLAHSTFNCHRFSPRHQGVTLLCALAGSEMFTALTAIVTLLLHYESIYRVRQQKPDAQNFTSIKAF